jgi:hypothetical protein
MEDGRSQPSKYVSAHGLLVLVRGRVEDVEPLWTMILLLTRLKRFV